MLKEPETDIETRAANLVKKKQGKALHLAVSALFLIIPFLCSSLSAHAACYLADTVEDYYTPKAIRKISYSPIPTVYDIQTGTLEEGFLTDAKILTDYFNERRFDGVIQFKCSIAPNDTYSTPSYSMSSGDAISITGGFIPYDQTIEVGVVRMSDLSVEIISFTQVIDYSYTVPASDSYQVYLHNSGSQTVDALGTIEFVR